MPTITRETLDARHGRYVAHLPDIAGEAELTYTLREPGLISADHTGVPDAMGGRGIGRKLVARMVADARQEGVRIVPLCSFVLAQARRHPDWADVFVSP